MKVLYSKAYRRIPHVAAAVFLLLFLLISATSAFLPSKPPSSFYNSFPTAAHHAFSMGFLSCSFQSRNYRDVHDCTYLPCDKLTRCFLSESRVDDIDSNGSSTGSSGSEPPKSGNGQPKFVYYKVSINDELSQETKVNVNIGDDIIDIKKAIKKESSPAFDSAPMQRIELFKSVKDVQQEKPPLDATMKWNPTVTWGTEDKPLIVQVPVNRVDVAPWGNSNAAPVASYDTSINVLVARQKMRAIDYWETSGAKSQEDLKDQVHDDVMKNLHEGKVLPIFHALCCPPKQRLFQPEQRVSVEDATLDIIQLSAAPVTMGECIISEKENETVGEISMEAEESYIPAFFTDANKGYRKVQDHSMLQWSFSSRYTKIITDLVNAPAEMAGEDIEVTELLEPLEVDRKNGRNLITRRLSRGVVADCFDKSESGSTYAITGNPGIGKSWTLIYALQQALLYENACVLLCFQKDGTAIVCIRRNDKIYVWQNTNELWKRECLSNLFKNSNVLALLDPRESKIGGAAYSNGRRMMIVAISNNILHLATSIKSTPDMQRILSTPAKKELVVSVPYMIDIPPGRKEMLDRINTVGPLPRYILTLNSFITRRSATEEATQNFKNLLDARAMLSNTGLTTGQSSLPGCIFAVNVMLGSNINDDGAPPSDQTGSGDVADDGVGYDGERILDYGNRTISLMSEFVRMKIAESNREIILTYWGVSEACRAAMGHAVEILFWEDLKNARPMTIIPMKPHASAGQKSKLEIPANCLYEKEAQIEDLKGRVFSASEDAPVIARMAKNECLLDFAGPGRRVYQVTISKDHPMPLSGLEKLFISSGHCEERNDRIVITENADSIEKIKWFWVVPREMASEWAEKKAKTKHNEIMKECIGKYIEQYVLVMDTDPTPMNSMSGRVDDRRDLQTDDARVPIKTSFDELKEKCKMIGVKIGGGRATRLQRLELVDNKTPDKVDAPTKEKLDVYTAPALRLLCDALGLSTSGQKKEIIQRLVDYATSKSLKNFASMLDDNVKIDYNPAK